MEITKFRDMYLAELQELRNAQVQLIEAHQRLADAASNKVLRDAFARHRGETLRQKERLDGLLRQHGVDPQAHTDQAMEAIIRETGKMISIVKGNDLRDAALIASAQKIAHYEMAAYGTAAALAGQLDLRDDQKMLHGCFEEERHADALLTELAKRKINPHALAA